MSSSNEVKLKLSVLQAHDLEDTGSRFDKQDPALQITVDNQTFITARQKDAGVNATFPETFEFTLKKDVFDSGKLMIDVEVFNIGLTNSKTHVGKASIPLKEAVTIINEFQPIRINLKHHAKKEVKEKGYVTMTALLVVQPLSPRKDEKPADGVVPPKVEAKPVDAPIKPSSAAQPTQQQEVKQPEKLTQKEANQPTAESKEPEPKQPVAPPNKPPSGRPSVKAQSKAPDPPMVFSLSSIEVKDLKNMESLPFDKNDVYVKMSYGELWKFRTPTQDSAGSKAIWKYADQENTTFKLSSKDFMETLLVVEAFDENQSRKDTLIGEAESSFPFDWMIAATSGDTQVLKEMTVPLMNNKLVAGQVIVKFMVGKEGAAPPVQSVPKSSPSPTEPAVSAKEKDPPPAIEENKPAAPTLPSTKQGSPRASVPVKEVPPKPTSGEEKLAPFTSGICKIKKIICQNLPNVESLGGKNDPFVTLEFGSQSFKTDPIDEGGANVTFDYLDYKLNLDRDNIEFQPLKVVVTDKNKILSDKVIGEATIQSLAFMLSKVNKGEVEVPVNLVDNKKKTAGNVILILELTSQDKEEDKKDNTKIQEQLKKLTSGELRISRIRMFDVPKMHNQSAFIKLNFGEWKYTSSVLDLSKVPTAIFDNLDICIPTNGGALLDHVMNGKVVFKTMMGISESTICSGSCSMQESIATLNHEVEITMNLVQKGSNAGRLVFFVQLLDEKALEALSEKKKPANIKIDPNFIEGNLRISSITVNGLKNKEIMGKQDPFVALEWTEWKGRTTTLNNQGGDCAWNNLDLNPPIVREQLLQEAFPSLKVIVYDDNTMMSDVVIGEAMLDIRESVVTVGKPVILSSNLIDKTKKVTGRITINCTMVEKVKEEKLEIAKGLSQVYFRITKIFSPNLNLSGNLMATPAPSITFQYQEWKDTTPTIVLNDDEALLDHLTMESDDFDVNTVKDNALQLFITDNKKPCGVATCNLMQFAAFPGKEQEVQIEIRHFKNKKVISKLKITGTIFPSTEKRRSKSSIVDEVPVEVKERKPAFTDGVLNIRSIKLTKLQNVEMFGGKIDPFAVVKFGDWSCQTNVLDNAGSEVLWNGLEFSTLISAAELLDEKMPTTLDIIIYDKNKIRSNVIIGKVDISIRRLAYTLGKEVEFIEDLKDNQGKVSGKLTLNAEVLPLDEKTKNKYMLSSTVKEGLLHISRISTFDLKNTELMGKQDPYVKVSIPGLKFVEKTPTLDNQGGTVIFDELDLKCICKYEDIMKERLMIEVYDDNTVNDTLIGSTSISLKHYITSANEGLEIPLTIYSNNKDPTGRLLLFAKLYDPVPEEYFRELAEKARAENENAAIASIVPKLPDDFIRGELIIKKIVAHNVKNTELFAMFGDKQDLYVDLKLNTWQGKTPILNNAGTNTIWDVLDLSTFINMDSIKNDKFEVRIMNQNSVRADSIVGIGEVKLCEQIYHKIVGKGSIGLSSLSTPSLPSEGKSRKSPRSNLGTATSASAVGSVSSKESQSGTQSLSSYAVDFSILLHDTATKNAKNQKFVGKLVLHCELKPEEKEQIFEEIEPSFKYGKLKISKIEGFKLANTELFGKADPYVSFTFGTEFSAKTYTQENIENNQTSWNDVGIEMGIYRNQLEEIFSSNSSEGGQELEFSGKGHLRVKVFDDNTEMVGDTLIGEAMLNLNICTYHMDKEMPMTVLLFNKKTKKNTGKLVIYLGMYTEILEEEIEIPNDLEYGLLRVKKIAVNEMKVTEDLLGLNKIDPYVVLSIPSVGYQVQTNVLTNVSSNITWDRLDFHTIVNSEALRVGIIECYVVDQNSINKDRKIGIGKISIKKFIPQLEQDVDCVCDIYGFDKSGKNETTKVVSKLVLGGMLSKHIPVTINNNPAPVVTSKVVTPVVENSANNTKKVSVAEAVAATSTAVQEALTAKLPANFTMGTIEITKIQAFDLQNKELMGGKQDPYIKLSVESYFQETLPTLNNAGSNPIWMNLTTQIDVSKDNLLKDQLLVKVFDENATRKDISLGEGQLPLKKVIDRLNVPVDYPVDLLDPKKGSLCGRLVLTLCLHTEIRPDKLSSKTEGLPESIVKVDKGLMRVIEIVGYDLKGGDADSLLGGKQDPYILVNIGKHWNARTSTISEAGNNPMWKNITDMECAVTKDILKYERLSVVVMDKNNVSKDSVMSRGDVSLRRLGSLSLSTIDSIVIKLKEPERGRNAGRLEFKVLIDPMPVREEEESSESGVKDDKSSNTIGKIQFQWAYVYDVKQTGMLSKQDLYLKMNIGKAWRSTTQVNKSVGTESRWMLKEESPDLASAHFVQNGLYIELYAKGVVQDTLMGQCKVSLSPLTNSINAWYEIKDQFTNHGSYAGKFQCSARFATDKNLSEEFMKAPMSTILANSTNVGGNMQDLTALQSSQDLLNKKVSKMEAGLKAHFEHELQQERKVMLDAMEKQNEDLKKTIEKLTKKLHAQEKAQQHAPVSDQLVAPPVQAIQDLQLPKDVAKWRTAHVQAWLAFEMELPQYLDNFATGSVDGLVLLNHVDITVLKDDLKISDNIHSVKILNGIAQLKKKYQRYLDHLEEERQKRLKRKAEDEAELERKRLAALKKRKAEKKAKKKAKTSTPTTYFGEVKESNILQREKIARTMNALHEETKKKKEIVDQKSKTWNFEYTGTTKPKVKETIWDHILDSDQLVPGVGTATYQKAMTKSVAKAIAPGIHTDIRTIPRNCSTDEVIAVLKGTMFEVSSWLLELEQLNYMKQAMLDHDLLEEGNESHSDAGYEEELPLDSVSRIEGEREVEGEEHVDVVGDEPPPYDEIIAEATKEQEVPPPPTYDEIFGTFSEDDQHHTHGPSIPAPHQPRPSSANSTMKRKKRLPGGSAMLTMPPQADRMTLIYNALIDQQNNDARWLGSNSKLTRLKLEGGITSLLKLKLDWSQFDTLWTKLDYKRTGDIDLNEFKAFFGDLSEFEQREGNAAMTLTSGAIRDLTNKNPQQQAMIQCLTKCLYDLCDTLRYAGFTVIEMFSGFDRNGSGEISISEFCSMLRTILGNQIDKRLIYKALIVLDSDGNKAISLQETLQFIYRIWKTQLDELADKLHRLDDQTADDQKLMKKLLDERQAIKLAIKKNFPRAWRDRFERDDHHIPGPFTALLNRLQVNSKHRDHDHDMGRPQSPLVKAMAKSHSKTMLDSFTATAANGGNNRYDTYSTVDSPPRLQTAHHDWNLSPDDHHRHQLSSRPSSAMSPKKTLSATSTAAGHNQLLRFKVKLPNHQQVPSSRAGTMLQSPQRTLQVDQGIRFSGELTGKVLGQFSHMS